jgi:hypothetical protein
MTQSINKLITGCLIVAMSCVSIAAIAGNSDRAGQAGATELLINPWARGSGWNGVNIANAEGLEAQFSNVAGLAFTKKTEIQFTYTDWLKGADVKINALGLAQRVGESGVLGLSVVSMDFGDIQVTTTELPEGGIGTFSPQYLNIGLSYAKAFSNSIYGGLTLKLISESISNAKAQGVAFDAGIQYVTGYNEERDNLKFGISLKNVGTPMKFSGDGFSFRSDPPTSQNYQLTVESRSQQFELPSLVAIGAAYDFDITEDHTITAAAAFTSNSFTYDQFGGGIQYSFREMFSLRAGYLSEQNIGDDDASLTALNGFSGGLSVDIPIGKSGRKFGIDYSYRGTRVFDGSHSIGARILL